MSVYCGLLCGSLDDAVGAVELVVKCVTALGVKSK